MAERNLNTLVNVGTSVVRDVLSRTLGMGSNRTGQAPAIPFPMRPQSQPYAQTEPENGLRHRHAVDDGVDDAADRAGRPAGCLGVLPCRSRATHAAGGARSTAIWHLSLLTARSQTSVGKVLSGQCWSGSKPTGATLSASTRGPRFGFSPADR
jgi:hypothetical protein